MLQRTILINFLPLDAVVANVQAKLQATAVGTGARRTTPCLRASPSYRCGREGAESRETLTGILGEPRSLNPPTHNLPPPVADFTGRSDDVNKLVSHLKGGSATGAVVGIHGMGGIGKTQLALAVAQNLRDLYPDQFIFELQPGNAPLASDALLAAAIRALDPNAQPPKTPDRLQSTYRDILVSMHGLLILDNAADISQVEPFLPPPPGWAIMVTSRPKVLVKGLLHGLGLLSLEDSINVLGRMLATGGRHDLQNADLAPLAILCGRLPLALDVAAGYLISFEEWSLASYLEALQDLPLRYMEVPGKDSVATVLSFSLTRLKEKDERLVRQWRDLAVFPAPFDVAAAAGIWNLPELDARKPLSMLLQQHLIGYEAGPLQPARSAARIGDGGAAGRRRSTGTPNSAAAPTPTSGAASSSWRWPISTGGSLFKAPYRFSQNPALGNDSTRFVFLTNQSLERLQPSCSRMKRIALARPGIFPVTTSQTIS